jgi:hypothetical protein
VPVEAAQRSQESEHPVARRHDVGGVDQVGGAGLRRRR